MSVNSILLHFSQGDSQPIELPQAINRVREVLKDYFGCLDKICAKPLDSGYLIILSDSCGVTFSVRLFSEGLITLNIEYFKEVIGDEQATFAV